MCRVNLSSNDTAPDERWVMYETAATPREADGCGPGAVTHANNVWRSTTEFPTSYISVGEMLSIHVQLPSDICDRG